MSRAEDLLAQIMEWAPDDLGDDTPEVWKEAAEFLSEPEEKVHKPDPFLVRHIQGQIGTMSGRRYNLDLQNMTAEQIRELHRLLRDIAGDHRGKINKMRREPWRRF